MEPRRRSEQAAKRRAEREREAGLDPEDEAARWLAEHDPAPEPAKPRFKSKTLHRFRQEQRRKPDGS
jgi:hypothetical protein